MANEQNNPQRDQHQQGNPPQGGQKPGQQQGGQKPGQQQSGQNKPGQGGQQGGQRRPEWSGRLQPLTFSVKESGGPHARAAVFYLVVIASQRVRPEVAGPMTSSANQSGRRPWFWIASTFALRASVD